LSARRPPAPVATSGGRAGPRSEGRCRGFWEEDGHDGADPRSRAILAGSSGTAYPRLARVPTPFTGRNDRPSEFADAPPHPGLAPSPPAGALAPHDAKRLRARPSPGRDADGAARLGLQYTLARTNDVEFARDGMHYKEFLVMFEWMHNGEGLTVFNLQGLPDPGVERLRRRVVRYAGFYMNEDPVAPTTILRARPPGACSTAAAGSCSAGLRPSTGPAIRSRSSTGSGPATARAATG
jgi:hypothetical protein